jgi:hypothetical protein
MKLDKKRKAGGNAFFIALVMISVLGVWIAVASQSSIHIARNAQRSRAWMDGTSIGLGAIDLAFSNWRQICRTSYSQSLPSSSFAGLQAPNPATYFPDIPSVTISNYSVQAVDPQLNVVSGSPPVSYGQLSPSTSTLNPANSTNSTFYLASADVSIPVIPGTITVKVRRVFEIQSVSPWNWAVFYDDPLEIHPGPAFAITGWVHTNDMLYTGHSSLTFQSKVTFVNGWNIGFMSGDGAHAGETPTSPYYPQDLPPSKDQSHEPNGLDPSQVFDLNSTNPNINGGWIELIQPPASPAQTDPLSASRYYNQANQPGGIRVMIDGNGNKTIFWGGTQVTDNSNGQAAQVYNIVNAAVITNSSSWPYSPVTIQDNREGTSVRLTTLDVSGLYNGGDYTSNSTGLKGFNGIIYITDTSATSTARRAIRLKNGGKLANGGLTVVSQNPIYVQGDYNTGTVGTSYPPSNSGDPTHPTVAGYNRQPAAIIGDAVNILSNNWNDANAGSALSSRVASNTTVNAAILGGIVPTGTVGNNYSGGAENFPRFLENWTNKSFTYYGSMVELYPSAQATGIWGSSNVYNPPNRFWYFDTNFTVTPPPGSLRVTNYVKQKWFLN